MTLDSMILKLMRILVIVPSCYGYRGDVVNERQLIKAIANKSERCYVITFIALRHIFTPILREIREAFPNNVTVLPIPVSRRLFSRFLSVRLVLSIIVALIGLAIDFTKKIKFIYIRGSFLSIGTLSFRSLATKTIVKIPAIIEDEITDKFRKSFARKLADIFDRFVLAKAGRVGVNSKLMYFELVKRRRYIHQEDPLEIPPGIDFEKIEKVRRGPAHVEKGEHRLVGFIGSLAWWQGVENLVQAVAILKSKGLKIKLIIIGDGELRQSIERLCKKLNVNYEITGLLPHKEALRRLRELDVMVLPRRRTPTTESVIPIKVIEAWGLGVPVIVTRHKGLLLLGIRDHEDVVYCEPEPNDVARALLEVLSDEELCERLRENGLKIARRYDYGTIADRVIKSVLSKD